MKYGLNIKKIFEAVDVNANRHKIQRIKKTD